MRITKTLKIILHILRLSSCLRIIQSSLPHHGLLDILIDGISATLVYRMQGLPSPANYMLILSSTRF